MFCFKKRCCYCRYYDFNSYPNRNDEIINIAVSEKEQGKGYGKYLLGFAIDYAKKEEYKTIEIGTGNSSLMQLGLYQKCGFRITSVDKDFFLRNYNEEIYENGIQCMDMIRLTQNL
ncbi:IAA acetyltransferase [Bacillus thuringiensis serovar israelensis ATCC 35646]|nr:IAA acetyltransferase [Bacillus thuringiensis serovar israelensis ATCC 35646]